MCAALQFPPNPICEVTRHRNVDLLGLLFQDLPQFRSQRSVMRIGSLLGTLGHMIIMSSCRHTTHRDLPVQRKTTRLCVHTIENIDINKYVNMEIFSKLCPHRCSYLLSSLSEKLRQFSDNIGPSEYFCLLDCQCGQ